MNEDVSKGRRSGPSVISLRGAGLLVSTCLMVLLPSCSQEPAFPVTDSSADDREPLRQIGAWRDATDETELDFLHRNGATGEFFISEILGSGGALFDHDSDGDLDLYLVQSGQSPGAKGDERAYRRSGPSDRLYRNDLTTEANGQRYVRFVDITEEAGLGESRGYGIAVAVGDANSDGHWDLYLANFGANQLFIATGDGRYVESTDSVATADRSFSTSAVWSDLDGDGHHDLFVGNYVDFEPVRNVSCTTSTGRRDWCGPQAYRPALDRLFRNLGNGRFEDVTLSLGTEGSSTATLGAVAVELISQGAAATGNRPELYAASDGLPNVLWQNQSARGSLRDPLADMAPLSGLAVNGLGRSEASMGIAVGDIDHDGDLDLVLGHLRGETDTIFRNDNGFFIDVTDQLSPGASSLPFTSFGIALVDLDLDGWLDLYATRGGIRRSESVGTDSSADGSRSAGERAHRSLSQKDGFLQGSERGFFEVEALRLPLPTGVGRGLIVGDVDNDGDQDLVVTQNNGAARLLLAESGGTSSWLGLRILEPAPNDSSRLRDAIGAVVDLDTPGLGTRRFRVSTDGSYASSHDPRIVVGLGNWPADRPVPEIQVTSPSGHQEAFYDLLPSRYHDLRIGTK